ncbi:hypothetical protein BJX99DRAFT_261435 [Aspergillus californicus]
MRLMKPGRKASSSLAPADKDECKDRTLLQNYPLNPTDDQIDFNLRTASDQQFLELYEKAIRSAVNRLRPGAAERTRRARRAEQRRNNNHHTIFVLSDDFYAEDSHLQPHEQTLTQAIGYFLRTTIQRGGDEIVLAWRLISRVHELSDISQRVVITELFENMARMRHLDYVYVEYILDNVDFDALQFNALVRMIVHERNTATCKHVLTWLTKLKQITMHGIQQAQNEDASIVDDQTFSAHSYVVRLLESCLAFSMSAQPGPWAVMIKEIVPHYMEWVGLDRDLTPGFWAFVRKTMGLSGEERLGLFGVKVPEMLAGGIPGYWKFETQYSIEVYDDAVVAFWATHLTGVGLRDYALPNGGWRKIARDEPAIF